MNEDNAGQIITDMLMECVERLGNFPRAQIDPRAWQHLLTYMPKDALSLRVNGDGAYAAADAFWTYWRENGETHKHGYYESTWGAINRALRATGVTARASSPLSPSTGGTNG